MTAIAQRPEAAAHVEDPGGRGDRYVAGGMFLLAALFVIVQLMAGEVIPPLAVPAVIYLALGAATWRRRARWLRITAMVVPTLHLLTSIPFLAGSMAHPESPAGFVPDAFITITALSVIAAAAVGLRGGTRRPITIGAGVTAAAAVAVSVVAAAGVESDVRQPDDVAVETVGALYPARIELPAGGAALWVDNQDPIRHTFVIEGTEVHTELPGSTAVRVDTDLAAGTYRYFCDVPGHERMEGELVVR